MNDFPRALSLKGLWGRNTHRRTSKKENLSPRQYQLRKQRPSRFCCLSASAKAPDPMKSIAHQEACTTTTVFDCCNCDASNSTVFGPDCGFGQHKRCEKCKWIFKLDDIRIMAVDHSTNGPRHHQDKERRGDDLFHLRPSSADQDNSVEDNLHPLFTDQDPTYWVCCNCSTKVGPEAATPCRTCGHYYCPSCAIFYSDQSHADHDIADVPPLPMADARPRHQPAVDKSTSLNVGTLSSSTENDSSESNTYVDWKCCNCGFDNDEDTRYECLVCIHIMCGECVVRSKEDEQM